MGCNREEHDSTLFIKTINNCGDFITLPLKSTKIITFLQFKILTKDEITLLHSSFKFLFYTNKVVP